MAKPKQFHVTAKHPRSGELRRYVVLATDNDDARAQVEYTERRALEQDPRTEAYKVTKITSG